MPIFQTEADFIKWRKRQKGKDIDLLVRDNFTGIDNSRLDSRLPDVKPEGATWLTTTTSITPGNGSQVIIQNNEVFITTDSRASVIDSGEANVMITARIRAGTASRYGIIIRHNSESDGDYLGFRIREPESTIDFVVSTNGTPAAQASDLVSITAGQVYEWKIIADGTTITAFLDGQQVLQDTIANYQVQTRQGIGAYNADQTERFVDFEVRKL